MGAGVADRLAELGLPARHINVSESPAIRSEGYLNLRAELWYSLVKQWFLERACTLNGDTVLAAELGWAKQRFTSSGKLIGPDKERIRKDHKKSPDLADAFALTFLDQAVSALHGSHGSTSWKEPLTRPIKCIV